MKLIILMFVVLGLTGCGLRQRKGEDIHSMTKEEINKFKQNLEYVKDNAGLCFAVLNNNTDGFRNTFTFAEVDCNKVNAR